MSEMIRITAFMHPSPYHYRTHESKCNSLRSSPQKSLADFLDLMHTECPAEPFSVGPRASKMRFTLPIELEHVTEHSRCLDSTSGLKQNAERFRTAHSQVQCFMLEHDTSTVAVEIPVWMSATELQGFPIEIGDQEYLSGHIDALSVEDGNIWIWDYKPRAMEERFAAVQVALYALMLSTHTGIELSQFRCGYFDPIDCFHFTPTITALRDMVPVEIKPSRLAKLTPEQRAAQKPPNLKAMGISRPHVEMNDSSTWSWHLLAVQQKTVSEIAEARCIAENTVYSHLESAIRYEALKVGALLGGDQIQEILSTWNRLPDGDERNVMTLFSELQEAFPVGLLRCVITEQGR